MNKVRMEEGWASLMKEEFNKPYFQELTAFVKEQYRKSTIYPKPSVIFRAFDACPLQSVKVVILGQDPYHGEGQADGLCFSVSEGVPLPPSLTNIFREIQAELGGTLPLKGDLERWATQGVLLLNTVLTVPAGRAGGHQGKGWELFTDAVIKGVSKAKTGLVFLLWGSFARSKSMLIDQKKHLVLTSPHPSPLSAHRGFFGNGHFVATNTYLQQHKKHPIAW